MNREVIFTMKEGTRYGVIKGLLKGRMTKTGRLHSVLACPAVRSSVSRNVSLVGDARAERA
jgi:hypothetical protein